MPLSVAPALAARENDGAIYVAGDRSPPVSDLASVVRDRGLARTAVGAGLLAAVLLALGESPQTTAVIVAAATVADLATGNGSRSRMRASTRRIALGSLLGASAVAWYATTSRVVGPVVALAVAGWLLVDGAVARHYAPDEPQAGDELAERFDGMGFHEHFEAFRELGEVGRELEDGPATPAELAARVEKSEDEVRETLAVLRGADLVARDGDHYYRTDSEGGVWTWPGRAASRLLRPFRVLVG